MQLGFSQAIPLTGGTITVGSAISRIDEFGTSYNKLWQTSPVVLSLQQDLFKPRDIVWNERIQSLSASVAERQYLEAREDVAGSIADAFFNLYTQQMTLANATANVAVNDTLYTLNKGRYEVGKIGENDLLKSELALLRARASVDDANLARDRAEAALRRMLNYPADQALTIVPPDSIPTIEADPDLAVKEALKNASLIEQSQLDEVNVRREITAAKLNNGFSASVPATVGFNQTASAFGAAYQSPLGRQSLTLGVTLPMVQWGAGHSDVEAAKADDRRVATNGQDAARSDRRRRAILGASAVASATQRRPRREGGHRVDQTVRGRAKPLHDRQDQQHGSVQRAVGQGQLAHCPRRGAAKLLDRLLPPAPRDAVRFRDQAGTGRRASQVTTDCAAAERRT